ncbi:hypothetical protein RUND412_004700 [Rhizina undulata]
MGHVAVTKLLVEKERVDINCKDNISNWTPLDVAHEREHKEVTKVNREAIAKEKATVQLTKAISKEKLAMETSSVTKEKAAAAVQLREAISKDRLTMQLMEAISKE